MQDKLDGLFLTDMRQSAPSYERPHVKGIALKNVSNNTQNLAPYQVWSQYEGMLHSFSGGDRMRGRAQMTLVDPTPCTRNRVDTLLLVNSETGEYISNAEADVLPTGFPGAPHVGAWHNEARPQSDMTIPCFTAGTLVATRTGTQRIEDLRPGDEVITRDNGFAPIRAISEQSYSPAEQRLNRNFRPVVLPAGTFGNSRDLHLSPAHRILLNGPAVQMLCDTSEVLVAAKTALEYGMVHQQAPDCHVVYYHILLDRHEVMLVEDIWVESLFLGDMPERVMETGKDWKTQENFDMSSATHTSTIRPVLRGFEARTLMHQLPDCTARVETLCAPNHAFLRSA